MQVDFNGMPRKGSIKRLYDGAPGRFRTCDTRIKSPYCAGSSSIAQYPLVLTIPSIKPFV